MVRKAVSCKPVDEGGEGASMPSDELFSKLQRCGETLRHIVNILHVLLYKIFEENICKQRITKFKKRHSVINSTKQKQICQFSSIFLPVVPFFVFNLLTSNSEPVNGGQISQTQPLAAFLTMVFPSHHEFKCEKTLS